MLTFSCLLTLSAAGRPKPGPPEMDTCAPGTNESLLPFCNVALGFEARASDLAARLNITELTDLFFSYPGKAVLRVQMAGG